MEDIDVFARTIILLVEEITVKERGAVKKTV
jgi:hypothetical protein